MARPKIIDYDVGSDEQIVTSGVEGAKPVWIGFDIDRQVLHIICDEGTLTTGGDDLEVVTRSGQQVTMEGSDVVSFYTANKSAIDAIVTASLNAWALARSKTGTIVES